jgi:hypothetical protein
MPARELVALAKRRRVGKLLDEDGVTSAAYVQQV